jgi:hypothetical protein
MAIIPKPSREVEVLRRAVEPDCGTESFEVSPANEASLPRAADQHNA